MKQLIPLLTCCLLHFANFAQTADSPPQSGYFLSESDFKADIITSSVEIEYVFSDASNGDSYIVTTQGKTIKTKKLNCWGLRDIEGNVYRIEGKMALVQVMQGPIEIYALGIQLERDDNNVVRGFTVLDPQFRFWVENKGLGKAEWITDLTALTEYLNDERDIAFKFKPLVSPDYLRTLFAFYKKAQEYNNRKEAEVESTVSN